MHDVSPFWAVPALEDQVAVFTVSLHIYQIVNNVTECNDRKACG